MTNENEPRDDYIIRLRVTVAVRVEGWDSAPTAIDRAREMLDEELDPTSFYIKGEPEILSVELASD